MKVIKKGYTLKVVSWENDRVMESCVVTYSPEDVTLEEVKF